MDYSICTQTELETEIVRLNSIDQFLANNARTIYAKRFQGIADPMESYNESKIESLIKRDAIEDKAIEATANLKLARANAELMYVERDVKMSHTLKNLEALSKLSTL